MAASNRMLSAWKRCGRSVHKPFSDGSHLPYDYFDAALASCEALTAMWYANAADGD
jgi:CDGSH-type Zn-finger protein